jgi:hypothetical protein
MELPPAVKDIFIEVGHALSTWAVAEIGLIELFYLLSDMPSRQKSYELFDSILNFEIRLSLCTKLMEHENLDAIELETWVLFSRHFSKQYKKRHELAHFCVSHNAFNSGPLKQKTLLHPFMSAVSIERNDQTRLTAKEIAERREKFDELMLAVQWFVYRAKARRGQAPEHPVPEHELILRLRASAAQNLEEQKKRDAQPRE